MILKNTDLYNVNIDYLKDIMNIKRSYKTIISLTIIPPRLINDDFRNVINSLAFQQLPADYIIINVCKHYKRNFEYDINKYNDKLNELNNSNINNVNIIINMCGDYGPATKLLGLINYYNNNNLNIDDNDLIIILDDDVSMQSCLTYYHNLALQLYGCDIIAVNPNELNYGESLITNEYKGDIYGFMSWSVKFKFVKPFYDLYNEYVNLDKNMIKHDDLIFTLIYKKLKMYICSIRFYFNIKFISNDNVYQLKDDNFNNGNYRDVLEDKYRKIVDNNYTIKYNYTDVGKRFLLYGVDNNNSNSNIDYTYITENILAMTITKNKYFDESKINVKVLNSKATFFIKYDKQISKINLLDNLGTDIFIINDSKLDINKLSNILMKMPSYDLKIYDLNLISVYNNYNVNNNNFKFIRAFVEGGIYFSNDLNLCISENDEIFNNNNNIYSENFDFFICYNNNNKIFYNILNNINNDIDFNLKYDNNLLVNNNNKIYMINDIVNTKKIESMNNINISGVSKKNNNNSKYRYIIVFFLIILFVLIIYFCIVGHQYAVRPFKIFSPTTLLPK